MRIPKILFSNIIICTALISTLMVGIFLRIAPDEKIRNIDEVISRDVVGGMLDRKDFNPDWQKVVPSLPYNFGKFRYNFSSYLLVLRVYCVGEGKGGG